MTLRKSNKHAVKEEEEDKSNHLITHAESRKIKIFYYNWIAYDAVQALKHRSIIRNKVQRMLSVHVKSLNTSNSRDFHAYKENRYRDKARFVFLSS